MNDQIITNGNIIPEHHEEREKNGERPAQEETMGTIGWIEPETYSFDCMLRMERFQIRLMLENLDEETEEAMAAALKANPKAAWLFARKCPELAERVRELTARAPEGLPAE